MTKDTKNNIIIFDSDKDFTEWAVKDSLVLHKTDSGTYYTDFDFTPDYDAAVAGDTRLEIRDQKSQILKHQCVTYRTISKPVHVHQCIPTEKYKSKS